MSIDKYTAEQIRVALEAVRTLQEIGFVEEVTVEFALKHHQSPDERQVRVCIEPNSSTCEVDAFALVDIDISKKESEKLFEYCFKEGILLKSLVYNWKKAGYDELEDEFPN